jgi:uncharacterized glyoxalase superfamily protein PhnB
MGVTSTGSGRRWAIIPCLRYADAVRALDFLYDAFGFERHAAHPDENNPSIIHHVQLA